MSPQHDSRRNEKKQRNFVDVLRRNLPMALSRRSNWSREEQRTENRPQKLESNISSSLWIYWSWLLTPHKSWRAKNEDAPVDWQVQAVGIRRTLDPERWERASDVSYLLQQRPPPATPASPAAVAQCAESVGKPEHNAVVPRLQGPSGGWRVAGRAAVAYVASFVSCRSNSYNLSRMGGAVLLVCICASVWPLSAWAIELKSEIHK